MGAPEYDMLVVGAGPAGTAAAIQAANRGLCVALVERARFPRDLPGECLHPDIEAVFQALGIREAVAKAGFQRNPGWLLEQGDESTFIPYGEPLRFKFGYQAWRAELDLILLERARELGVHVNMDTDAREVLMDGERVAGLALPDGTLTARFLVDASGPHSWLSRKLALTVDRLSPKLVSWYGYSDHDLDLGVIPRFRELADGWTWLARVRKRTWQWAQLSLTPEQAVEPPPADWGFPERLRGADVSWRLVRESAGPGYFLCGDAAATIDPGASRGVARALDSGIKAADFVARVVGGEGSEIDACSGYRSWLSAAILSEAGRLAERYARLEKAPSWIHQFLDQYPVAKNA